MYRARPPAAVTAASTSAPLSSDRPVNPTAAPSAASIATTPAPMPRVAPGDEGHLAVELVPSPHAIHTDRDAASSGADRIGPDGVRAWSNPTSTQPPRSGGDSTSTRSPKRCPALADRFETTDVTVTGLQSPEKAGTSSGTILFTASWSDGGQRHERDLVIRTQPDRVQLYRDADFHRQYAVLDALHRSGRVRVPEPLFFEPDPSLVGVPFFVMEQLHGNVPVTFPGYNVSGFLFDATPAQRRVAWESAVEELCRIALVPVEEMQFLDQPELGPTAWSSSSSTGAARSTGPPGTRPPTSCGRSHAWLEANLPAERANGFAWGDARIGNMMFGDDFRLAGVMDWEAANLSWPPPGPRVVGVLRRVQQRGTRRPAPRRARHPRRDPRVLGGPRRRARRRPPLVRGVHRLPDHPVHVPDDVAPRRVDRPRLQPGLPDDPQAAGLVNHDRVGQVPRDVAALGTHRLRHRELGEIAHRVEVSLDVLRREAGEAGRVPAAGRAEEHARDVAAAHGEHVPVVRAPRLARYTTNGATFSTVMCGARGPQRLTQLLSVLGRVVGPSPSRRSR